MTSRLAIFILSVLFYLNVSAQAEKELTWPREVDYKKGLVTLYQPQLESYEANILQGRSAISYKPENGEMSFGAFWFRAFLQTDREERTVLLDQVDVLEIKFPGLEDSTQVVNVTTQLEALLESMEIVMSLDRLVASLDETGASSGASDQVSNTPPDIYYKKEPTVLITIDGEPIWKEMDQYNLKAVVNSPFFIVQDDKSKKYFINGGEFWYTSENATSSEWELTKKIPSNVSKFAKENAPKLEEGEEGDTTSETEGEEEPPKILVVTEPSELIVTYGEPDYQPVDGTDLLYVANTESDIILDISNQQHYVLMAGRWYQADKLAGDQWTFTEPASLPDGFSDIPTDSDLASVRTSVPGTPESRDALLEQSIPQTAEVSRADTKIEVNFDGTPKFKKVANTEVSYAENCDKQVMKIDQKYYAVDNGIWFVSDYPEGPYAVSDKRPEEVDDLPADSPVYNTKYVYVYDSTPTTVYVGYTPGYTHAYVYNGVVVYGTGFYYPYWYGAVYYPRPVTFGFNVHYNPYTGWGFSFGISAGGWIGWGYHPYYRPYWGPTGYRYGYRAGYGYGYNRGFHHGYNRGYAHGYARGYRAGQNNAYRNQRAGVNTTTRNRGNIDRTRPSNRKNDHYADRSGNVYQRDKSGNFQQRSRTGDRAGNVNRTGQNARTTDRATNNTRQGTTRNNSESMMRNQNSTRQQSQNRSNPSNQNRSASSNYNRSNDLNRAAQNRQRGNYNYQQNRSRSQSMNRGGATRSMPRGGGGRRR